MEFLSHIDVFLQFECSEKANLISHEEKAVNAFRDTG